MDGLTYNRAVYRALLSAVRDLPTGAEAEIFSSSRLVCHQFDGSWAVRHPELRRLLHRVRAVIRERGLSVTLLWIPREQNLAGELL